MAKNSAVTVRSVETGEVLRVESDSRTVPATLARAVWARDGLCCRYCGFWSRDDAAKFELDHVHPWWASGRHSPDNLVVACRRCNRQKADEIGWTPLTGEQARSKRRERRWALDNGRRWVWRPDRRCMP